MPRELTGYRDEVAYIISVLGNKGWYSTAEIAKLDYGEAENQRERRSHMESVRNRYKITDGGLTQCALARKRALIAYQ